MRTIITVAREAARTYLPRLIEEGASDQKIVDMLGPVVWCRCLKEGVNVDTVTSCYRAALKATHEVYMEPSFPEVKRRARLVLPSGTEITRDNLNNLKSRGYDEPIHSMITDGMVALSNVVHFIDPEIWELRELYLSCLTIEERLKHHPKRAAEEWMHVLNNMGGLSQHLHNTNDCSSRMYANTGGIGPMWDKVDRATFANPVHRTTPIEWHVEYLLKEFGIQDAARAWDAFNADRAAAYKNGLDFMESIQLLSFDRIRKTGKTNIPVEFDAPASGNTGMLLSLRDPSALKYACVDRKDFEHPHDIYSVRLRRSTDWIRNRKLTLPQIKPLSKGIFTPCMYGAGAKGLFSAFTSERIPEDLCDPDTDTYLGVSMPPLVDQMLEGKSDKVRAHALFEMCEGWARLYGQCFPKHKAFADMIRNRWENEADAIGLTIVRHGTPVLFSRLRRDKSKFKEYAAEVLEGTGVDVKPLTHYATVCAPKYDNGTAAGVQGAQGCDALGAAASVVFSEGRVRSRIHDASMIMLADVNEVMAAEVEATNWTHSDDWLETGKKQVMVPKGSWLMKPFISAAARG